jgi:hypothetical protein
MTIRGVPTFVVSMLGVCGALGLSAIAAAGSRGLATPTASATPTSPSVTAAVDHDSRIGWQMSALERRARFDMILYAGPFHRDDLAAAKAQTSAFALSLSTR